LQNTADTSIEDAETPVLPTPGDQSSGNPAEMIPESELDVNDDYLTDLERATNRSLYLCQNPHSPEMVYFELRFSSFETLPHLYNTRLNKNRLAAAGFFYLGE